MNCFGISDLSPSLSQISLVSGITKYLAMENFFHWIGCSNAMLPVSWDSLYFSGGFWLQDSVVVFGCRIPVNVTLLCLNHNRLIQPCEHIAFMHVQAIVKKTEYSCSQCSQYQHPCFISTICHSFVQEQKQQWKVVWAKEWESEP